MLNAKIVVHMMALGGTASQFLADPQHVRIILNNNPFLKTIQNIINKLISKNLTSAIFLQKFVSLNMGLSIYNCQYETGDKSEICPLLARRCVTGHELSKYNLEN